jgi:hypothetical protein
VAPLGWLAFLRVGSFALAALVAVILQGARAPRRVLAWGALAAGLAGLASYRPGSDTPGAAQALMHLECSILAAVLLGSWLARGLRGPADLLAVVLCAAAADAWLTVMRVPESVSELNPLRWLRLPWPSAGPARRLAPVFTDLIFCALYLEAARVLGFRKAAVALGALAGYTLATMLSVMAGQVLPSLPLVGLGALLGAWPPFRCSTTEVLKAVALASLLFALLLGLSGLRRVLHPPVKPRPDIFHPRGLA